MLEGNEGHADNHLQKRRRCVVIGRIERSNSNQAKSKPPVEKLGDDLDHQMKAEVASIRLDRAVAKEDKKNWRPRQDSNLQPSD